MLRNCILCLIMSDIILKSKEAVTELEKLKSEMLECNSDRTLFQLEKFVMGQHDTPGRQYLQVMTELSTCYFEIKRLMIDLDEARDEYDNPDYCIRDNDIGGIDTARVNFRKRRFALKIEHIEFQLDAKYKEFAKLMSIKATIKPYTSMEIEKEDAEYYQKRLERQSSEFRLSHTTGIPVGEIRAQEQAGMVEIRPTLVDGMEGIQLFKLGNISKPQISSS